MTIGVLEAIDGMVSAEKELKAFIPSQLDDYGLPSSAFRVYCHLVRRAGAKGAWPSVANMARVCRLHPQTVRKSLRLLKSQNLIRGEPRSGDTTIYWPTSVSDWKPPVRSDQNPSETKTASLRSQGSAPERVQAHSCQSNTAEGNPMEGNQEKGIHVPPKAPKGDNIKNTGLTSSMIEEIYNAYPKKVGKPNTLRAIRRALKKHSFDFLLERTRLYAQVCNVPSDFIPNPSTWFNQERFNDDPRNWRRTGSTIQKTQPAVIRPDQFGRSVTKL